MCAFQKQTRRQIVVEVKETATIIDSIVSWTPWVPQRTECKTITFDSWELPAYISSKCVVIRSQEHLGFPAITNKTKKCNLLHFSVDNYYVLYA